MIRRHKARGQIAPTPTSTHTQTGSLSHAFLTPLPRLLLTSHPPTFGAGKSVHLSVESKEELSGAPRHGSGDPGLVPTRGNFPILPPLSLSRSFLVISSAVPNEGREPKKYLKKKKEELSLSLSLCCVFVCICEYLASCQTIRLKIPSDRVLLDMSAANVLMPFI